MAKIRYIQAVEAAMREEMDRDPNVFVMGLDVEAGMSGTTVGMVKDYGKKRVIDTPLSELGYTGLGVGAAMAGLRPIIENDINSLQYLTMEQLVNQAGKLRYMTGGQVNIPLTVRIVASGGGGGMAAQHSDSTYAQLIHMGMKVVVPATPYDAKGLIKQAIREDDPVVIYEPGACYGVRGEVPDEEYTIPLGEADIKHEGTDVTVVAVGHLVNEAVKVAKNLEKEGISVEVVDPRTLFPLDTDTILKSVEKTGHLVVVDDGYRFCSFASEVAAIVADEAFESLKAPIKRVTRPQVPVPYSKVIEMSVLPGKDQIQSTILSLIKQKQNG
ncbi:alpha-ketoacid dehydrogenase subunit beta [Oceanobacillus arenosus]|uniref:Alpha-ketoacid dehydrogenase subunit beta n=1 Tax=Oceanobacillus arenosus TaxID=1229153 RepID=A0A3D8Q0Q3_9BACI|nr:alpha-ketoacid dehydrogenase subunit beta [Oceanobacillus arenosus]RDW21397.1 alpha-ketoacid dehydrogenase subunit beta [Oceanobacillus arenosus]